MRTALHSISRHATRMSPRRRAFAIIPFFAWPLCGGVELAPPPPTHPRGLRYFAELKWRSIGPPRSGYVSAPAGVPGDPTTYYVGLPEGGVWKTTNAGTTWTPIFDEVHVASLAPSPSRRPTRTSSTSAPATSRAGRSRPARASTSPPTRGDLDATSGFPRPNTSAAIVVDPRNADAVLVAAQGRGGGAAAPPAGPRRTPRARRLSHHRRRPHWTRVLPADGSAGRDRLSSRLRLIRRSSMRLLAGGAGPGVFRSADGGATWQPAAGARLAQWRPHLCL